MQNNQSITPIQLVILLISTSLGVGILTMPRSVAEAVPVPGAWIAVLLAGGFLMLPAWAIGKLTKLFPQKSLFAYSQEILGRFGGWILTLLIAIEYTFLFAYDTRIMAEIVRQFLLDKTPIEVISLIMFFASAYLVTGGMHAVVRINLLFLPLILVFLVIGLIMNLPNIKIDNLQPVFTTGVMHLLNGAMEAVFPFLGFDVMLFFAAYLQNSKKSVSIGIISVSVTSVIYVLIMIFAIGILGAKPLPNFVWAGLEVVRTIEVPGSFLERYDSIFLTIWLMAIFTTVANSHYMVSKLYSQLFRRKERGFIFGILPAAYLIMMIPQDLITVFQLGKFISYSGAVLAVIVPIILLLITKIRGGVQYAKR